MKGIPVEMKDIPRMLHLYLMCSPNLDLNFRCLPRDGGWLSQDYETVVWFGLIEQRVKEILNRQSREMESKLKSQRSGK